MLNTKYTRCTSNCTDTFIKLFCLPIVRSYFYLLFVYFIFLEFSIYLI